MLIVWYQETVFYQICPLGLCGAPEVNDDIQAHRILKIKEFVPYLEELGIGAVYFNPVFNSDSHGYDTRDYNLIDTRLGTNEDFEDVCKTIHNHGIKIVLDGVFNHVGRGFLRLEMFRRKDLQANMLTGSISILMEILAMVMDSGMKDGKVIMNL